MRNILFVFRILAFVVVAWVGAANVGFASSQPSVQHALPRTLPPTLADTGLYADPTDRSLSPALVEFQPRFPLWTDGLLKRRWIQLPPGASIDASDAGLWQFPVGTKVWKEFALPDRPVETRYMEHTADGWLYGTYVWDVDATTAILAPMRGVRGAAEVALGVRHDIPGRYDCTSCHEGQSQRVLGFSAVQLAAGRTQDGHPDLLALTHRGLLSGVPETLLERPSGSRPPSRQEAALGYLHGNCGHCHNAEGPLASLGMNLRLDALHPETPAAVTTAVGRPARTSARAASATQRIAPGDPENSQIVQRLSTRDPLAQMPPLGTHLVDQVAVDLLIAWIRNDLKPTPNPKLLRPFPQPLALELEFARSAVDNP